jgi:hypothetical protein
MNSFDAFYPTANLMQINAAPGSRQRVANAIAPFGTLEQSLAVKRGDACHVRRSRFHPKAVGAFCNAPDTGHAARTIR